MFTRIPKLIISRAEAASLRHVWYLIGCWVFLRIFFEGVLERHHHIGFAVFSYRMLLTYFVHFPLFYLTLFLLLVMIISALTEVSVKQVTKVASIGLGAIVFVPVIDWLVNRGYMITYPLRLEPYFLDFLVPSASLADIGVSPGQRIVAVLVSVLVGLYVYSKTRNYLRAIALFVLSLVSIVIFGALTTILAANRPELVFGMGSILQSDTQKYCAIYVLFTAILGFGYLLLLNREFMKSVFRFLRLERVVFYGAMSVFGFGIAVAQRGAKFEAGIFNFLGIVMLFLSTGFGFWSLQVFNDLFDLDADRVLGKMNPLVEGADNRYYNAFCVSLAALALCCAVVINFTAFLILTAYLLLGVVYSLPPVRLKRFPVISTFTIGVAVCLAIGLGFSVYYGGRALNAIPGRLLVPTLIGVTLGFTAKDIAHVDGDRAQHTITLPVLFYESGHFIGRLTMAIIVSASYLVYILFIPQSAPGAIFCALCTLSYLSLVRETKEIFFFIMLYGFGSYLFFVLLGLFPF